MRTSRYTEITVVQVVKNSLLQSVGLFWSGLTVLLLSSSSSAQQQSPTPRRLDQLPVPSPSSSAERFQHAIDTLRRELDSVDADVKHLSDQDWEELQSAAGEILIAVGERSAVVVNRMVREGRFEDLLDDLSDQLSSWTTDTVSTDDIAELESALQQILRRELPSRAERQRWEDLLTRLAVRLVKED